MSERRACRVIGCQRMTVRYRCRLRERLVALARERRRFGYRRLLIFLRREGFKVNHKRLFRLYREERLIVRKRGGRKRALGSRTPMPVPARPNELWVLDFVADQLVCGRRFRILAIYNVCIRRCLAAVADFSLSGRRVARELDRLMALHGKPKAIGSDNGTELTSNAILTWTAESGVDWHYIAPGKPVQNAFWIAYMDDIHAEHWARYPKNHSTPVLAIEQFVPAVDALFRAVREKAGERWTIWVKI